jgi:arabinofuranosyltransferase
VAGAILAHLGYYTLRVGGDYFEYRVFAHLIPLSMVAAAWLLGRASLPTAAGVAALAGLVAASLPIPWALRSLEIHAPPIERDRPYVLAAVAPVFPGWMRGYVGLFDALQSWLIPHGICVRHEQHVRFFRTQAAKLPSREQGWAVPASDHPILAIGSVGLVGWAAPRVAVLDRLGLNDAVVARTPVKPGAFRRMAHERHPPPGYIECFAPNVAWSPEGFTVTPRAVPVTDATIVACESRFLSAAEGGGEATAAPEE